MITDKIKTICIDDSEYFIKSLSSIIMPENFDIVMTTNNIKKLILTLVNISDCVDLIIADVENCKLIPQKLIKSINKINPNIKLVMVCSKINDEMLLKIKQTGVKAIITKPFNKTQILNELKNLFIEDIK